MDTSNSFTVTTQQHDNEEDLFIEFPQEILEELGWEEGDILNWDIQNDNQIIITKVKDTIQPKEEPTIADYDWYTVKEEAIKEHIQDNQSDEQSKDRTVPPPTNFPYFP